jgi:hypothetical protein
VSIDLSEQMTSDDPIEVLKQDLQSHLDSYTNESAALASFERFSGLNRKTLKGFLEKGRQPYPQTIYNFCKWLYKTVEDQVIRQRLSPALHHYLAQNGYPLDVERKEIASVICKSPIHLEIYLMSEDYQIVERAQVQKIWGQQGLEAYNEFLLLEVLQAIDEERATRGKVRSIEDDEYFRLAAPLIPEMFPWDQSQALNGRLTLGNIVVEDKDVDELRRTLSEFERKLCEIHARGVKAPEQKRLRYVFSAAIFRTTLERSL